MSQAPDTMRALRYDGNAPRLSTIPRPQPERGEALVRARLGQPA